MKETLTLSDISNRLKNTRDHDRRSSDEDVDDFSSIEKLLLHNEETQEYQRIDLSDEHLMKDSEDSFDYILESDHNNDVSLRSSEDEHQSEHFESVCR